MAKLQSRILTFNPSASNDEIAHRVRIFPDGLFDVPLVEITSDPARKMEFYGLPFTEIPVDSDNPDAPVSVDIATMAVAPSVEGVYDTAVTAVDKVQNEGDAMEIPNTVFDFSPPAAPTGGSIS